MSEIHILLESFVIGLAIAAPVGPIGVLCIQRTLAYGVPHGFVSGMGAATADAAYGMFLALGLVALTEFLVGASDVLAIAGGAFLVYLGVRTLQTSVRDVSAYDVAQATPGLLVAYTTTLALTLANPLTILAFVGIFAGIGDAVDGAMASSWLIVLGIFLGSASWWLTLSAGVGLLRARIRPGWLVWINRLSGVVISGFALRILVNALT